jgi:hypothetical protein
MITFKAPPEAPYDHSKNILVYGDCLEAMQKMKALIVQG